MCSSMFVKNGELDYASANPMLSDLEDCFVCKAIVKITRELIKHSKTKDAIRKALHEVCKHVRSHKCTRIVDKHFDQFVKLILAGTEKGKICKLIGLC